MASKKITKKVTPNNPLGNATDVRLTLSKADVFDMCLTEAKIRLEDQVDEIRKSYNAAERALKTYEDAAEKAIAARIKEKLSPLFTDGISVEVAFGTNEGYNDISKTEYYKTLGVHSQYDEYADSLQPSTRRRRWGSTQRVQKEVHHLSSVSVEGKTDEFTLEFHAMPSLLENLPELEAYRLQAASLLDGQKELRRMQNELASFDRRSAKAKVKLIRTMLEGSEQGQAILAQIGDISLDTKLITG